MKIGQLRNVLTSASEMYHEAGNSRIAASLATFIKLLNEFDQETVTAFAKQLGRSGEASCGRNDEIRTIFERLRSMYVSAGANAAAGDFEKLISALNAHSGQSVNNAVAKAKAPVVRATRSKRSQVDPSAASTYGEALLSAGTNQATFNAAFEALRSDRGLSKAQLDSIANRYLNEPSGGHFVFKFKSKTEALETIRRKFIERAQSESKREIIEKMTRW
jgi:hypothetical protein